MSTVRAPRRLPAARPQPQPRVRPAPELRVVAPPRARRAGMAAITFLAVLVVFAGLFALAIFNTWLVQNQQRLDQLHRDVADAQAEYEQRRLDVARLESPEQIVATAVSLGMVPPQETTYLTPSAPLETQPIPGEPGVAAGSSDVNDLATDDWPAVKPFLDATP